MIYGYARVSTDGQSVAAQVEDLTAAGAAKVYRETASGVQTDRAQLRRVLADLDSGDVLLVTRLDRLARSTLDLLHTLKIVTDKGAGFRSLGDAWADTTSPHGRLMLRRDAGTSASSVSLRRHLNEGWSIWHNPPGMISDLEKWSAYFRVLPKRLISWNPTRFTENGRDMPNGDVNCLAARTCNQFH